MIITAKEALHRVNQFEASDTAKALSAIDQDIGKAASVGRRSIRVQTTLGPDYNFITETLQNAGYRVQDTSNYTQLEIRW